MSAGCPFITCAIKKKKIEFCWQCDESEKCGKWEGHREFGKKHDTFKSYGKLESDIAFAHKHGIQEHVKQQQARAELLTIMLAEYNEGRSKSYYCIAATLLDISDLLKSLTEAKKTSEGLCIKDKAKCLHSIIDKKAKGQKISLSLRK